MMERNAVFRSAQQAVFFAYMIGGLPAREASAFAKLLDRLKLEATGEFDVREASSVNFSGLSDIEVRGQCAMVRAAVEMLPDLESWALRARYGVAFIKRDGNRQIVSASYGGDRTRSMRNLALRLAPAFGDANASAVMLLIARLKGECDELRPTFRQIEAETGLSKSSAERLEKRLKHRLRELENAGLDRLTPGFVRDGLIEAEDEAQVN